MPDNAKPILIPSDGHVESERVTLPQPPKNSANIERGGRNDSGTADKGR